MYCWNEKQMWVDSAIFIGGSGAVLCENCNEYRLPGDGGPACRTCPEAIRQFPDQPEEHFNRQGCTCANCRELQKKYLPKQGR